MNNQSASKRHFVSFLFAFSTFLIFDISAFAQISWSITVETNPTNYTCLGQTIPVSAADSCPTAITTARTVFNSIRNCPEVCPLGNAMAGNPRCRVNPFVDSNGNPGQNFQVTFDYSCGGRVDQTIDVIRSDCDEEAIMRDGMPVFPEDAIDIGAPTDVVEDRGLLSVLYPDVDTTTDEFYPLPCEPSLGGTLPPETDEIPSPDEFEADKYLRNFDAYITPQIVDSMKTDGLPTLPGTPIFTNGLCHILPNSATENEASPATEVPCDSPLFLRSGQPFEGRDIIYVHGLATENLKKWIQNDQVVRKKWPQDSSEFLDQNGYFRTYARNYWRDHIRENLFDPNNPSSSIAGWQWTASDSAPRYNPKSNRYLLVSWSSNQTIEYAQHALLEQIRLAITTNKNVVTPPTYPTTHVRPFCSNGCIIISHSTGGLIVSSAMALANLGFFGPGAAQIPDKIRTHVAFEGAISGSRLASAGMAVGLTLGVKPRALCLLVDEFIDITDNCLSDLSFVRHTILRDLMPPVAQGIWGPVLALSPVPTLTVAGGHPLGNHALGITKLLLPGLDDGVVSMNSACGNPNPVFPPFLGPSGIIVVSNLRAFEMSKEPALRIRAVKNFISHKDLRGLVPPVPTYLAGACTPYRSPTGMVMPVVFALSGTLWDTRHRYPNHYSFIQGSIDHAYDGGGDDDNKWPSALGQPASTRRHYLQHYGPNVEETSAVTDRNIYRQFADGTYLVHPSFSIMREVVTGRPISFSLRGSKNKRRVWIWKRTFHLLDKWEEKQSSHYVYEFVGRR